MEVGVSLRCPACNRPLRPHQFGELEFQCDRPKHCMAVIEAGVLKRGLVSLPARLCEEYAATLVKHKIPVVRVDWVEERKDSTAAGYGIQKVRNTPHTSLWAEGWAVAVVTADVLEEMRHEALARAQRDGEFRAALEASYRLSTRDRRTRDIADLLLEVL